MLALWGCTPSPSRSPAPVDTSSQPSQTVALTGRPSPTPSDAVPTPDPGPDALDREFEAAELGDLPEGRVVKIDDARVLEEDGGRWLILEFAGGRAYTEADTCSRRYVPWFAVADPFIDVVNVAIVELARPPAGASPSNAPACDTIGVRYIFRLRLETDGIPISEVIDRAGGSFYLLSGSGVIEDLPEGWSHQLSFDIPKVSPPWQGQVYAAESVEGPPYEGRRRVVLYEAFPESPAYAEARVRAAKAAGATRQDVVVQGQAGRLWVDAATGRMLLVWSFRGKSSVMVAYRQDFSRAALLSAASSITLCCG